MRLYKIVFCFFVKLAICESAYPYENSIKWVSATSPRSQFMLLDQIPVGIEVNNQIFLCRIHNEGNTVPGKLWITAGKVTCNVPYRGEEYSSPDFEMLVTFPEAISWKVFTGNENPDNMIPSGKMDGEFSYICRVRLENDLLPGRLSLHDKLCYVGRGGKEYTRNGDFEYLGRNYLGITLKTPILSEVTIGDSADGSKRFQENEMINLFTTIANYLHQKVSYILFI